MQRFGNEEIKTVVTSIKNSSYLSGYTNKFLGGEDIQKFEEEFARYHGCKFGVAVNSGTTALFVAQKAGGVKHNSKVAVPCITFTATTSQVLACDAIPLFVDIDKLSYCMNYEFNNNSKFVIPVHLLGHPCNFDMIKEMKEQKIFVIEDCAQAMGAKYKGKVVGSMGDCAIFSFQETKHITTLGEGGMIITNSEEFADQCRKIRNHGEYYRNEMSVGYNFRMTEVQASFGRVQLRKLNKILSTFRKNANFIIKNLPESITPPYVPKGIDHSFLILGCRFNEKLAKTRRDLFIDKLTKNRKRIIGTTEKSDIQGLNSKPGKIISSGYRHPQYHIPLYRKYTPTKKCVNGEDFTRNSIFLDIHRWRTLSEIKEELEIINSTLKYFSR